MAKCLINCFKNGLNCPFNIINGLSTEVRWRADINDPIFQDSLVGYSKYVLLDMLVILKIMTNEQDQHLCFGYYKVQSLLLIVHC